MTNGSQAITDSLISISGVSADICVLRILRDLFEKMMEVWKPEAVSYV